MFSAPAVISVAAILAFPVLYGMFQSLFRAKSIGLPTKFVGIDNYTDMFADPEFWRSLRITVVFVLGCLIVNTVIGVLFAFALNRAMGAVSLPSRGHDRRRTSCRVWRPRSCSGFSSTATSGC